MYKPIPLFLLLTFYIYSQTPLSGKQGGMTFEPAGSPYIIKDTIIIQQEKKTVIKAGCRFLFHPRSGSPVDLQKVLYGHTIFPPGAPTLQGQTLVGWFRNAG